MRRIASLSAFLLAVGVTSASQAGIIPWVYDSIFGPVRYPSYGYGYSPYAASYGGPVVVRSSPRYAPASYGYYAPSSGCSSCSSSYYAPVSYSMPSYGCGGCGPIATAPSCGPCGAVTCAPSNGCLSGCSVAPAGTDSKSTTPSNGKSAWNSSKKVPEPSPDKAPEPTFEDPNRGAVPAGGTTDDGLGAGSRIRSKPIVEEGDGDAVEVKRPAGNNPEPTILNRKKAPAKTTDDLFEQPFENDKPTDGAKEKSGEAKLHRPLPKVNLDDKIAWRIAPQHTRVMLHAKLAKASVTRRVPTVDSDWTPVVARVIGTQVVKN